MNLLLLGNSEFTIACGEGLLKGGGRIVAVFAQPEASRPLNSIDLRPFAARARAAYHEIDDVNAPESLALIRRLAPDYLFSTWPKIIGPEALTLPKRFTVGSHPTDLPKNRGRHPLHWLFVLGFGETALTLFKMDAGADTGDILVKERFKLGADVAAALRAMNAAARKASAKFVGLARKGFAGKLQTGAANTWRKRTQADVTLDPRMTVADILRTIRSFSKPYPGANLIYESHVVKIFAARPCAGPRNAEPGRVLKTEAKRLAIKAADGAVWLESDSPLPEALRAAKHVHPPLLYGVKHADILRAPLDIPR